MDPSSHVTTSDAQQLIVGVNDSDITDNCNKTNGAKSTNADYRNDVKVFYSEPENIVIASSEDQSIVQEIVIGDSVSRQSIQEVFVSDEVDNYGDKVAIGETQEVVFTDNIDRQQITEVIIGDGNKQRSHESPSDDCFKQPMPAETNPTLVTDTDGACQVCFDKGSGYHYSAFTCEGCKGFFKRTVQRNLMYKCKAEGNCVLNRQTRNNCQACRFDACILVGMKREAVREDRSPGWPSKNRPKHARIISGSEDDGSRPPFDDELVVALFDAQPYIIPPADLPLTVDKNMLDDISLKTFMHFGYTELRYIIDWAKKVPGFKDLVIDDQMALLKSSFMELNVLRLSYRSLGDAETIVIADGIAVATPPLTDLTCGIGLIEAAAKFAQRLQDTKIDITEFCILNSVVLTFPDAVGLSDRSRVLDLQSKYVDALRRYSLYQYPGQPHRYGNLLLRLPILRTVSAKAAERFLSMSLDGNLPLSALVCEMMN